MDTHLADSMVGRVVDDRYRVTTRVASGGMATVYLATDSRLDRTVALKVMHAELARDEDFVRRFIGEAKSAARLSHPNVVSVFDQGTDGSHVYLSMEYVPGETLRDLLRRRGRFPAAEALSLVAPLLSGLAAAHRAGIVHRDVKPENVLITPDGWLKVADFGLARAFAGGRQTRSGIIMGTAAYLAPEQVSGTSAGPRVDVYAAGIMLFELLTGRPPHAGDTPLSVAYQHVHHDVPAPSSLVPEVPPPVDRLVAAATTRNAADRPADAGALLREVDHTAALVSSGTTARPDTFPAAPDATTGEGQHTRLLTGRRRSRRVPVLVAVALAVAVVAGLAGWWLTEGRFTTVPSVAGMTTATAGRVLRHDGFIVATGTPVADNRIHTGRVVRTTPGAGGHARHGSTVTLVTSAGPRMITIPSVAGLTQTAARTTLRHAGLTAARQVRTNVSSSVAAGRVSGTSPAAGTRWPQTKAVTLTVSQGPPLPRFVGERLTTVRHWAATTSGRRATLDVRKQADATVSAGVVVSQTPDAGTAVTAGEKVTVVVSTGPAPPAPTGTQSGFPVPSQARQSLQRARQELRQLGINWSGL